MKRRSKVAVALVAAALLAGAIVGLIQANRRYHEPAPRSTGAPGGQHRGGSAVFAAQDWPQCLNPITFCASTPWACWAVLEHVLPAAMVLDPKGDFVASPLLLEAPSIANGGLTSGPFTITYRINPKAVWADGTAITSADFAFTWRGVMNTKQARSRDGYRLIESIDTSVPMSAVIRFRDVYIDWPDLFGGPNGGILEQTAFSGIDPERPDLSNEMQDSIPFSGGPWILRSWNGGEAVLDRNARYFGRLPLLDRVTFIPRTLAQSGISSLIRGEVSVIGSSRYDENILAELSGQPDVKAIAGDSQGFEALWFNVRSSPLDDPRVRQALTYAIDRQAVIDGFVKPRNPGAQVLNCGFVALPSLDSTCRTTPFAAFAYDPARAKSILRSDGYDCSATPCTKSGRPLIVEYSVGSDNTFRRAIQQLLKQQAAAAGLRSPKRQLRSGHVLLRCGTSRRVHHGRVRHLSVPGPINDVRPGLRKHPLPAEQLSGKQLDPVV
jgi:peptide/nickel transport system substrate-binding protein